RRRGNRMQTVTTTRRAFLMLLGGAAVAGPWAVSAQTPAKVYRVGLLSPLPVTDNSRQGAPLIRGLAQHGYVLERNLALERRAHDDFEQAFAVMNRDMPDAILMVTDVLTNLNHKRVFEFAAAHRLPAIYEADFLVRDGGLMSYGPDLDEIYGRVAALVDRILK